ncbi:MAG: YCF48-related protein [Saprospiraceae bacterium]
MKKSILVKFYSILVLIIFQIFILKTSSIISSPRASKTKVASRSQFNNVFPKSSNEAPTSQCWEDQSRSLPARNFNDVFTYNDKMAWAVSDLGDVWRTKDGKSWGNVYSKANVKLYGIHFINEHVGWCVGSSGTISKSIMGGQTGSWSPQDSITSNNLKSVFFIDENYGWVVDDKGFVYSTSNGGSNWNAKNLTSNKLEDIFFINNQTGWIVGSPGIMYKTTNGGNSWRKINTVSNLSSNTQIYGIHFVNDTIGFFVGIAAGEGNIYKSDDGGENWRSVHYDPNYFVNEISFSDSQNGWASGQEGTKGFAYETKDGGETWNIINMLPSNDKQFYGVSFDSNSNGWIVGQNGTIFKYTCSVPINPCRLNDSLELVKLYNSTNGPNWIYRWELSKSMDNWYGVQLNSEGCVTCLDLCGQVCDFKFNFVFFNNLKGQIPNLNLAHLVTLDLSHNQLEGNIPNFNLPNLKNLSLGGNQLSGNIPDFNLPNLENLYLGLNKLNGPIPSFNFPKLKILILHGNQLSDNIPDFNFPKLEYLDLSLNKLSGSLLNFTFPLLQELLLDGNILTGSIPNFNYPNLTRLYLSNNRLTGNIPNFQLDKLIFLNLRYNQLDGSVPNFNLTPSLSFIDLDHNNLANQLPIIILNNLNRLWLQNNNLSKCIPAEFKRYCAKDVNVSNNPLLAWNGNFNRFCNELEIGAPCDDGNPNTTNDKIDSNCVCIGMNINTCDRISDSLELRKFFNNFNGSSWTRKDNWLLNGIPISSWFGVTLNQSGCIDSIILDGNRLDGQLYDFNFNSIRYLDLDNNLIFGQSPDFQKMINLNTLYYRHNILLGPMPSLNYLPKLKSVGIRENKFTFTGLKHHINKNYLYFDYFPQDTIFKDTTYRVNVGQSLLIDLSIDQNIFNNDYRWFKNSSFYQKLNSNRLIFNSIQFSDSGTYRVEVTNPDVPGLTLYSFNIKIIVTNNFLCTPAQSETCDNSNVFCSLNELNGYSCQNNSLNYSHCSPLCSQGGAAHNTNWWGFVSQGGNCTISITTGSCITSQGIQYGIWGDCNCGEEIACNSIPCAPPFSITKINVNLLPCKTYYFWIDGCSGDICDFTINTSGGNQVNLLQLSSINDEMDKVIDLICLDSCNYSFYIPEQPNQCKPFYSWTLDGRELNIDSSSINIKLFKDQDYELCVTAIIGNIKSGSICDSQGPVCSKIRIRNAIDRFDILQSIITPNNDGLNDKFEVDNIPSNIKLCIINKWGAKVFCQNNYDNSWSGEDNNHESLPDGVYLFILNKVDGSIFRKGHLTIKRL